MALEEAPPLTQVEEDQPDYVRMGILAAVLIGLVAYYIYQYFNPPQPKFFSDLPGVEMSGLSPTEKDAVLKQANSMRCDCHDDNCHYTVAECRHGMGTTCDSSLKLSADIVRQVSGKSPVLTVPLPSPMAPHLPTKLPNMQATPR